MRDIRMGIKPAGAALPFEINGRLLFRNSLLSVAGQVLPLVVGVATVPTILRGLGVERFGLLVFAWTLTGMFSIFDFGLSGAVTKFVAEALGRGDPGQIPRLVWTAALGAAVLGLTAAAIVVVISFPLVVRFLNVPVSMHAEAILAYKIVAFLLPLMLLLNVFRGAVEAAQRFDIAALVKGTSSLSTFLAPLIGVLSGWNLPPIMSVLLAVRLGLVVSLVIACTRVLPLGGSLGDVWAQDLRRLLRFGGWITLSGLIGFALIYGDRLVIGRMLAMTALTYYTIPLELISRFGFMAATLAAVFFPAFSTLSGAENLPRLTALFGRSVKYVMLATIPVFGLLAVFASDILKVWLGAAAAAESAPVLRILAFGAAFQVVGVIPMTLVHGLGRPDIAAKVYFIEAPLYLLTMFWLVALAGIRGAAVAWSGRFVLDSLILFWIAGRMGLWSWSRTRSAAGRIGVPVAVTCVISTLLQTSPIGVVLRILLIATVMVSFGLWAWMKVLHSEERAWILQLSRGRRCSPSPLLRSSRI